MLSRPGALPDFTFLMAASSSSTVKSDDRLAVAVAAPESEVTSRDVQRAKSLSASVKRPLFSSCEAIAFAVSGHPECGVLLPVSLFMVCHALRLECVKSTDSTTSVFGSQLRPTTNARSELVYVFQGGKEGRRERGEGWREGRDGGREGSREAGGGREGGEGWRGGLEGREEGRVLWERKR